MNHWKAAALASGLLLASPAVLAGEPMEPSTVGGALMSASDQKFFPAAASANELEIEASKLALTQSQNTAVKTFAQHMIDDHTKAGEELKALAAKKSMTVPTTLAKHHQMMLDHLKKKDAKDFDGAYKHLMLASHKEAVTLFGKVAKDSKDADVKAWAAQTLPKLEQHGGMAKDLPDA